MCFHTAREARVATVCHLFVLDGVKQDSTTLHPPSSCLRAKKYWWRLVTVFVATILATL